MWLKGLAVIHKMMDLCNPTKIRNCTEYHAAYCLAFDLIDEFVVECL